MGANERTHKMPNNNTIKYSDFKDKWGRTFKVSPKYLVENYDFDETAVKNYWTEDRWEEKFIEVNCFGYTRPGEDSQFYDEGGPPIPDIKNHAGWRKTYYYAMTLIESEYDFTGGFSYYVEDEDKMEWKNGEVLDEKIVDRLIKNRENNFIKYDEDFNRLMNPEWKAAYQEY